MTHRYIDTTIHELSGPQTLNVILRMFNESKSEPVIIAGLPKLALPLIQKVRTELSRARNNARHAGQQTSHFGFDCDYLFSMKDPLDGIVKDIYAIKFRITMLQQLRNNQARIDEMGIQL